MIIYMQCQAIFSGPLIIQSEKEHTHKHAHTQFRTHALIHSLTHPHFLGLIIQSEKTHTRTHARAHTHANTHTDARTHTRRFRVYTALELKYCLLLSILFLLFVVLGVPPPPVQNMTTLILYTDPKTWNEAKAVCESQGQKLLDITYSSIYYATYLGAKSSPWKDVPVA